jgi:hypothetical protein
MSVRNGVRKSVRNRPNVGPFSSVRTSDRTPPLKGGRSVETVRLALEVRTGSDGRPGPATDLEGNRVLPQLSPMRVRRGAIALQVVRAQTGSHIEVTR